MARILVIDDDTDVRRMVRNMLDRAGHEVAEAPNGDIGTKMFRKEPFDLIITDIFMPEKEGLETIRELHREFPDLRIIAISGGGSVGHYSYLPLAKSFGATRTLSKPFSHQELLEIVNELLTLP